MTTFQWANDPNTPSLTPQVIVPDENKPINLSNIPVLGSIPIIDMSNNDNEALVIELSKACEEYGFFQLKGHGISSDLCKNVLDVITQFFELPHEEKANLLSTLHMEDGKIFRYFIKDVETQERKFMWGEAFFHSWHPVDPSFIEKLPTNPTTYRKIISEYIKAIASLMTRLLSLISQALGLDEDYLQKRFGENPLCTAQANYYPPCPNPDLTLGLRDHTDLKILTVLLQDDGVTGLQILKDGEWFGVAPEPGALIVNVADQLQVLSNDKFKSVVHRAVTNKTRKRVSFGLFMGPQESDIVGPIPKLNDESNPPLYRNYLFSEFMEKFRNQEGKRRMVKEEFIIEKKKKSSLMKQVLN